MLMKTSHISFLIFLLVGAGFVVIGLSTTTVELIALAAGLIALAFIILVWNDI